MIAWTGVIRARFAGGERPWLWRVLHSVSYLCWPVALLHGLRAGRPPAVWVTASYLLLGLGVVIALAVRLHSDRVRRKRLRHQGQRVPTRSVAVHNPSHRARGRAPVNARFMPEDTSGALPTLVDLDTARVRRNVAAGARLAPARYAPPPRAIGGERRGNAR
jgi:hypothetical protein